MKRKSKLFLIRLANIVLLISFVIVNLRRAKSGLSFTSNEERLLSVIKREDDLQTDKRQRPVIHTFFNRIAPSKKGTGMSGKSDEEHVAAWKEQWSNAGWDPVVLNLEDAKKHPRYNEFVKTLENVPLMGGNNGLNKVYNQLCFLRWMAMAAAGGGWMSDYDVIPLRHIEEEEYSNHNNAFLPNDGFFTVYSVVRGTDQGVPCLMSGSTEEWEKMAFKIVENGATHPEELMWSDMFALMDLRHQNLQNELFIYEDKVIPGQDVLLGHYWSKEDCTTTKNYRAVHFSHHAVKAGNLIGVEPEHGDDWDKLNARSEILQNWHRMWKQVCEETKEDGN